MAHKHLKIGYGVTVYSTGFNQGKLDGIGYYTQELAKSLSNTGCELFPVRFGKSKNVEGFEKKVTQLPRFTITAGLSTLTGLPPYGSKSLHAQIDLFHSTDHHIPLLNDIPHIATIMDAIPLAHPEWANQRFRSLKNWLWRRTAQWPDHVITISNYSKQQLVDYFKLKPECISVTPLGVDQRYFEHFSQNELDECLKQHTLPDNFFLFIGTLQPRKNLGCLIAAHRMLPKKLQAEFPLVVVGRVGWGNENWPALLNQKNIIWLEEINDTEKRALLQTATALTFPSLSEGFGLPVLEAFASGLPVIASNTTSLPEVAGSAAVLVDPTKPGDWCEAMQHLALNDSLRTDLKHKGLDRAKEFSWNACAQATLNVYQRVLE